MSTTTRTAVEIETTVTITNVKYFFNPARYLRIELGADHVRLIKSSASLILTVYKCFATVDQSVAIARKRQNTARSSNDEEFILVLLL